MRLRKTAILGAFLALFILTSCTSEESKENTQSFMSGVSQTAMEASQTDGGALLNDFQSKNPPISTGAIKATKAEEVRSLVKTEFDSAGVDSLYGTWKYYAAQGWVQTNDTLPESAIRFEWTYWDDSLMTERDAYLLMDSIYFYQDSMPENIRVSLGFIETGGDNEVAWMSLSAEYQSADVITYLEYKFEIVNEFQIGASISSDVNIEDEEEFVGEVKFWVIDRTNNDYRIDLTLRRNQDDTGKFILEDSDGWKIDTDISAIVEVDTVSATVFEKREVDGQITKSGNHAADITGYVWEPEDTNHQSSITIIYPDGTEEDFEKYFDPNSLPSSTISMFPLR